MKTTKLSLALLALALMAFTPKNTKPEVGKSPLHFTKTSIKWKSAEISLGEIPQNKPVNIEFEFTNTGETPVLISNVQASCGCTSTNYEKTPIAPGHSGKITATFNAAAKGLFKKTVTVTTSAEETPRALTFTGTVI